jgi:LuxR family maltose regulon positive regulatory protein
VTDESVTHSPAARAAPVAATGPHPNGDDRRFRPPPLPDLLIRRERLLHLLDAAVRRRVTLVMAPAGYGKTTLVAQWVGARQSRRVAWVTVTPADNEPGQFEQRVHAAVQTAGRRGDGNAQAVHPRGDPSIVLVLDEVHTITNTHAFDRLAADLDALPSLRVILLSRSDPLFPSYRFRLRDQVAEIRQRDLAFDRWEAHDVVAVIARRSLSDDQVVAMVERTEGWPAGLHLAAVSIRNAPDPAEFISTFGADGAHVADYLSSEMLRMQPADVQRFLLATSVLDRLTASLCDHVLETTDSDAMLARLERAAIMIAPVDDRRAWFRYHRLLRSMMRQELRARDPGAERPLLERAAAWHLAHDNIGDAIGYLAEAGAWDDAASVILRAGGSMLAAGRSAELLRRLELLPRRHIDNHPSLLLLEASARVAGRQTLEARRLLKTITAMDGLSPSNAMAADVLHAVWQVQHGSPEAGIALADRALEAAATVGSPHPSDFAHLSGGLHPLIATAHLARAIALLEMGEIAASSSAVAPALAGQAPVIEARALGIAALDDALSGRFRAAHRMAAHAIELAGEQDMADGGITAPALLARAMVARAHDDTDEAGHLLERAKERIDPGSFIGALVRIEQSKLMLALGNADEATALITFTRDDWTARRPLLASLRRAIEAHLAYLLGSADRAQEVLDRQPHVSGLDVSAERLRIMLARRDYDGARLVLGRWPGQPDPQAHRVRALWSAVVQAAEHDGGVVEADLVPVLTELAEEADVGTFLDIGRPVLAPLRVLYRKAPTPFLRRLIEHPGLATRGEAVSSRALAEQLTKQELVVLSYLPSWLSNTDIAEQLGVSLNTVKTHLKHIYRKLEVTDRKQAIEVAERIGLL